MRATQYYCLTKFNCDEDADVAFEDYVTRTSENNLDIVDSVLHGLELRIKEIEDNGGGGMPTGDVVITSFTNNINTVEKGRIIKEVTLKWETNKLPKTLHLNNSPLDPTLKTKTMLDEIKADKTFTLRATGENDIAKSKTTTVTFCNGVYYGASSKDADNLGLFLDLTKILTPTKVKAFTTVAEADKYIYYCLPSSYGSCQFTVNGFTGGFSKVLTRTFNNIYGHEESYDIYKSTYSNLGLTSVVVS